MKKLPIITFLLFILPLFGFAQDNSNIITEKEPKPDKAKKISIFELLSKDSLVTRMVLTTDINKILKDKYSEEYIPSNLSYIVDKDTLSWDIGVATRGKSRKKICDMPPLRLKFSNKDLKGNGLKKHNTLKLVTYCKNKTIYNRYIIKEFIAYKLMNILTDYSFKVKLIHLQYKDVENRRKPIDKYAFLIENTDEMSARLHAKELENFELCRDSCVRLNYDLLSMYQYMISNTDWNMGMLHNIKIIKEKKTGRIIPIAYDFDYSGFVNTDYSIPNPDYPYQADVRQRIYIGECRSVEDMKPVADLFVKHKTEILDYCGNFEALDERTRKSMVKYLNKFYKTIENPKKLRKRCLDR